MNIDSFISILLILAFIVPGFIFDSITRKFIPKSKEDNQSAFLNYLTSSTINYGFWIWLIYWAYSTEFYLRHPFWAGVIWLLIILVSPLILGFIWVLARKFHISEKITRFFGIHSINPIPTSWDYKFSNISPTTWILVTLKDGSVVGGYFGSKSFASSETNYRDLFIEKVYKVNSEGPWSLLREKNDGILISHDQIKTIEFFNN